MKRFVKGFYADYQNDLVEKINVHAEQNKNEIEVIGNIFDNPELMEG